MRPIQRVISAGFATAAIASASVPALAWTVWPDVDFEWYASVGKPVDTRTIDVASAAVPSYSWGAANDERPQPRAIDRRDDPREFARAPVHRDASPPLPDAAPPVAGMSEAQPR